MRVLSFIIIFILLLCSVFHPFECTKTFATVSITKEEVNIFEQNGCNVECIADDVNLRRLNGETDEQIRQSYDNLINELKKERERKIENSNSHIINNNIPSMLSSVLLSFCLLFVIWFIPTALISLLLKKIIKRKISKGWCVFIATFVLFINIFIEILFFSVTKIGIIDTVIRLSGLSIVFIILYDKTIPSILDSEKELKRKSQLNQINQDTNTIIWENSECLEQKKSNKLNYLFKNFPKENYHIFGYLTFFYLLFILCNDIILSNSIKNGYYEILHWIVFSFSIWSILRIYKNNQQIQNNIWILLFFIIAIIYNPIFKLNLEAELWEKINIIILIFYIVYSLNYIKKIKIDN